MKNFLTLLTVTTLLVLTVSFGIAEDTRCPLTGHAYTFEVDDTKFELSGFDCTFGPGCLADCDLWYGDFDTGPLYHVRLPFQCELDGSVIIDVVFDEVFLCNLLCGLTSNGNLECLIVDVSNYTCRRLGNKTWCVPGDNVLLNFKQE